MTTLVFKKEIKYRCQNGDVIHLHGVGVSSAMRGLLNLMEFRKLLLVGTTEVVIGRQESVFYFDLSRVFLQGAITPLTP